MIVKCIAMVPRTHLSSASSGWIDLCPTTLGRLSISPTDVPIVIERENRLARHDMCREMEFGHEKMERLAVRMLDMHPGGICLHPLPEIDPPLTRNVV
jgi:hypothetical protein